MKTIKSSIPYLTLFILLNLGITVSMYAQKSAECKQITVDLNIIDLGSITKQVAIKTGQKKGLLIKSKKFVFYINRKDKNLLFVSEKFTLSKGDFIVI